MGFKWSAEEEQRDNLEYLVAGQEASKVVGYGVEYLVRVDALVAVGVVKVAELA